MLYEREDWPDRTVVYYVGIIRPPAERVEGSEDMRVIYDPRSVQRRRLDAREDGSPGMTPPHHDKRGRGGGQARR